MEQYKLWRVLSYIFRNIWASQGFQDFLLTLWSFLTIGSGIYVYRNIDSPYSGWLGIGTSLLIFILSGLSIAVAVNWDEVE